MSATPPRLGRVLLWLVLVLSQVPLRAASEPSAAYLVGITVMGVPEREGDR